jgi:hypothetical protein
MDAVVRMDIPFEEKPRGIFFNDIPAIHPQKIRTLDRRGGDAQASQRFAGDALVFRDIAAGAVKPRSS